MSTNSVSPRARAGSDAEKPISKAQAAHAALRDRIVACEIPPGAWVTEAQLSEDLDVGKTPVREALRQLVAEGFLEPSHRRGYQVAPITVSRAIEVFEAFSVLLPQVAMLVSERATDVQRSELASTCHDWYERISDSKQPGPSPYSRFVTFAGNDVIVAMTTGPIAHLERILNYALPHVGIGTGAPAVAEFDSAMATIGSGNPEEAGTALGGFLETLRDQVIETLRASASLMDAPVQMPTR